MEKELYLLVWVDNNAHLNCYHSDKKFYWFFCCYGSLCPKYYKSLTIAKKTARKYNNVVVVKARQYNEIADATRFMKSQSEVVETIKRMSNLYD